MPFGVAQPRQHDLVLGIQDDRARQPAVRLLPLRAADGRLLLPVVGDDQIGQAEQPIAQHGIGAHVQRGIEQRPARELHPPLHDAVHLALRPLSPRRRAGARRRCTRCLPTRESSRRRSTATPPRDCGCSDRVVQSPTRATRPRLPAPPTCAASRTGGSTGAVMTSMLPFVRPAPCDSPERDTSGRRERHVQRACPAAAAAAPRPGIGTTAPTTLGKARVRSADRRARFQPAPAPAVATDGLGGRGIEHHRSAQPAAPAASPRLHAARSEVASRRRCARGAGRAERITGSVGMSRRQASSAARMSTAEA